MSDFIVGLTGGIGSGKSAVADLFAAQGIAVVDTDAIAHELTGPDGAAMPAIVAAFGPDIRRADGGLDRAAMRRTVFADPAARSRLEGILHPMIRSLADARCRAAASPYVILAVPLLVEAGAAYRERSDRILVVDCDEATQVRRVQARNGLAEAEVRAIIASQATRGERLTIADDIIVNDSGLPELAARVLELHQSYSRMASAKGHTSC